MRAPLCRYAYILTAAIKYLNKALKQVKHTDKPIRVHIDGGANRSITNDISLLSNFKNIKRYSMQGVAANEPALYCTDIGLLPWKAYNGDVIFVKCYYSEAAADTIISPTDVVINHITAFNAWGQYSNIDTGEGRIEFHHRNHDTPIIFTLTASNDLWYHNGNGCIIQDYQPAIQDSNPTIK